MKLKGILNSDIAKGLADLGHMDLIAVGDCGLPIDKDKKMAFDDKTKNEPCEFEFIFYTNNSKYVYGFKVIT